MPGIPSITWSDANDARLLQALVVAQDTVPSEAIAQQIADLMGCGVTAGAIKHRIKTHKSKGRAGGGSIGNPTTPKKSAFGSAQKTPMSRTKKTSPMKTTPMKATPSKQKRLTKLMAQNDSDSDDLNSGDEDVVAPECPTTTRARRSMSKTAKKIDYAKLADPHADDVSDHDTDLKRKRDEDSQSEKEDSFKVRKLSETVTVAATDSNNAEIGFGDGF